MAQRNALEQLPSAKEIKARYERIFPALPLEIQDAYVRLIETLRE